MKKKKIKLITFKLNKYLNQKKIKKEKNNFFVGDWCNLDNDYFNKKEKIICLFMSQIITKEKQ